MNRNERTQRASTRGDAAVRSRGRSAAALGLVLGAGLLWAADGSGQQAAPPVFPSAVETVRVDVVVTGANGRPATGLRRDDFVVREDGVEQAIVDFEAVGGGVAGEPPAAPSAEGTQPAGAPAAPASAAPVALPTAFLIVFDEPQLTIEQAKNARAFVVGLLESVRPGDRVTLVAAHDGRWWSGVGPEGVREVTRQLDALGGRRARPRGDELMTPYEAMRIVQGDTRVEQVVRARARAEAGLEQGAQSAEAQVPLRARAAYGEATQHVRRLLELVGQSLELVPRQRGRTTLVLASSGFVDDAQLVEYRELVRRFVRTGVTAYFYDARDLATGGGLGADSASRMGGTSGRLDRDHERRRDADQRLQSEALDGDAAGALRLADETGGFTIRVSDTTGIARLASDAHQYYLIGYAPSNMRRDGKLRRISVEVRAPGASARARKAYYAPTGKDARAAVAASAPMPTPAPGRRDEAAARYLALVESHRSASGPEALEALSRWPDRELRRAANAAVSALQGPPERRWAAVVLHTNAALRYDAQGALEAFERQRDLARELLAQVRGTPDDADFERLWFHAMGDHELALARIREAIELFDDLAKRYPQDAEAQLARGRAHEAALFVLSWAVRAARADQPDLTSDIFVNSRYRPAHGVAPSSPAEEVHRDSALAAYREAVRLAPALLEARLRLGRVLWLDGKLDEAERELAIVAAGPSPDGRQLAHLFLARIEDERGRQPQALAHAEAAVALRPHWQSSRLELAGLLRRAGRGADATRAALAALAPPPGAGDDGWLRYNLGAHDRAALVLDAMRAMARP